MIEVEIGSTGQIVEFPDGTTPEVMQNALAQHATQEKPVVEEKPKEEESFFGAGVIEPAATILSGAIAEPLAGLIGLAGTFGGAEQGAEAVEATRKALTYQPRTTAGKEGLQAVGEVFAPVGRVLQEAETFLGDETFEATKSPALAAAAATIPTAIIEVLGLAASKGVIKGATKTRRIAKNRAFKQATVEAAPDIDQIKAASRGIYKELDESGVFIKPEAYDRMVSAIETSVKKAGFDPDIAPKTAAALNRIKSEVDQVHSLTEVDTLRKIAQSAASTIDPSDARLGSVIIDTIDQTLDTITPESFTKGTVRASEVAPKYRIARELWGRAKRSELINEAFEKAKNQASGFENGIVTQMRQILNNKKKSRFFKPQEIKIMQEVVRGTTPTNIAKLIGRLGFSEGHATNILGGAAGVAGGAAIGGPVGAVTVPLVGQVSRKLAQKLTRGKAEFADIIVRAGENADEIVKAYLRKVPKAQRTSAELSELLLRPDIAIADLMTSESRFIREAAEITQGQRALLAASIAPGVREPLKEEER